MFSKKLFLPLLGTIVGVTVITLLSPQIVQYFQSNLFSQSTSTAPVIIYKNPYDNGNIYEFREENSSGALFTNVKDVLSGSVLKSIQTSQIGSHTQIHGAGAGPYMAEYPNLVDKYSDMLDGIKLSGLRFFQGDLSFDQPEDNQKYWDALQRLASETYQDGDASANPFSFMSFVDYVRMSLGKIVSLTKDGHFIFTVHAIYALDPEDGKAHYVLENKEKYIPIVARDNAKLVQKLKDSYGEAAFKNFYFEIGNEEYLRLPSPVYAEVAYASIQEMRKIVPGIKIAVVMRPMFNGDPLVTDTALFNTVPLIQFSKNYYASQGILEVQKGQAGYDEYMKKIRQFDNRAMLTRLKELNDAGMAQNSANNIKSNLVGIQLHSYVRENMSGMFYELNEMKKEAGFEHLVFWFDEFNFYSKWAVRGNENPTNAFAYLADTLGILMRPDVDFVGEHSTPGSGLAEYRIHGVSSDPDWEIQMHHSADPFLNSSEEKYTFYRTMPLGIVHRIMQDALFSESTFKAHSYVSYKDILSLFGTTASGAWRGVLMNKTNTPKTYTLENIPSTEIKVYQTQTNNTERPPLIDLRDDAYKVQKASLTNNLEHIYTLLLTKEKELYARIEQDTSAVRRKVEEKIAQLTTKIDPNSDAPSLLLNPELQTASTGAFPTSWNPNYVLKATPIQEGANTYLRMERILLEKEMKGEKALPEEDYAFLFQWTTNAPIADHEYVASAKVRMIDYNASPMISLVQNQRITNPAPEASVADQYPFRFHTSTWDKEDLSPTEWRTIATPRVKLDAQHFSLGVQVFVNKSPIQVDDIRIVDCTLHPEFEGCYTEELRALKHIMPKNQIEEARDLFKYEHPMSYTSEVYDHMKALEAKYKKYVGEFMAIDTGLYATHAFRLRTLDLLESKIAQYLRYEDDENATILLRDALRSVIEYLDTENTYAETKVNQNQSLDQLLGAGTRDTGVTLTSSDRKSFSKDIAEIRTTLKNLMKNPGFVGDYIAFFRSEFLPKVEYTTLQNTGALTLTLPPESYVFVGDTSLEIHAEETLLDSLSYLQDAGKATPYLAKEIPASMWNAPQYQNTLYDVSIPNTTTTNINTKTLKEASTLKDIENQDRGAHVGDLGDFRTFSPGRNTALFSKAFRALGLEGLRHFTIDRFDPISEEVSKFMYVSAVNRTSQVAYQNGRSSGMGLLDTKGSIFNASSPLQISLQELTDLAFSREELKDKRVMMAINVAQAFDPELAAIYKLEKPARDLCISRQQAENTAAQSANRTAITLSCPVNFSMDHVSFDIYKDKQKAKELLSERAIEILQFLKARYGDEYYKTFIFEMGNEYWDENYGYLDTDTYFESSKAIIDAMRSFEPRVRTSVIFTDWQKARTLSPLRYDIDGLTIHLYTDMGDWGKYMNTARSSIAPFGMKETPFWISEYDQDALGLAQQKYWDSGSRYIRSIFALLGRKDVAFADFHNIPQTNFTSFIHQGVNSILDCRASFSNCFMDRDEFLRDIGRTETAASPNPLKNLEREVWVTNFPGYVSKAMTDILYGSGSTLQTKSLQVSEKQLAFVGTTEKNTLRMAFANTDTTPMSINIEHPERSPLKIIRLKEETKRPPLWDITTYNTQIEKLRSLAQMLLTAEEEPVSLLANSNFEDYTGRLPTGWEENCTEGGNIEDGGSTSTLSLHAVRLKVTGNTPGHCLYKYNGQAMENNHTYVATLKAKNESNKDISLNIVLQDNPNGSGGSDKNVVLTPTLTTGETQTLVTPKLTVTSGKPLTGKASGILIQNMTPGSSVLLDDVKIFDCTIYPHISACASSEAPSVNLLKNGEFENFDGTNLLDWKTNCALGGSIEDAGRNSPTSAHALRFNILGDATGFCLYQYNDTPLIQGHQYVASMYVKSEQTTPINITLRAVHNPNKSTGITSERAIPLTSQNWTYVKTPKLLVTTEPTIDTDKSGVLLLGNSPTSSFLVDSMKLVDCTLFPSDTSCLDTYVNNEDFEQFTENTPSQWNTTYCGTEGTTKEFGSVEKSPTGSGGSLSSLRLKANCLWQHNIAPFTQYHQYVAVAGVKNEANEDAELTFRIRHNPNSIPEDSITIQTIQKSSDWKTIITPKIHAKSLPVSSGVLFQLKNPGSLLIDKVDIIDCTLLPTNSYCMNAPIKPFISEYVKERLSLFLKATSTNEIRKELVEVATVLQILIPDQQLEDIKDAFMATIHSIPMGPEDALSYIATLRLDQMPSYEESIEYFSTNTTKELTLMPHEIVFVCEGDCGSNITEGLLSSKEKVLSSTPVKEYLPKTATIDTRLIYKAPQSSNSNGNSNTNSVGQISTNQNTNTTTTSLTQSTSVLNELISQSFVGTSRATFPLGQLPVTYSATTSTKEVLRGSAPKSSPFKDINTHFARQYIEDLYVKGIIQGKTSTLFAPNDKLTRAEGATLVTRTLGLEKKAKEYVSTFKSTHPSYTYVYFKDVPLLSWFAGHVGVLKDTGNISGMNATTFAPSNTMSRAEFLKILLKNTTVSSPSTLPFRDTKKGDWYFESIQKAYTLGILDKNSFAYPHRSITRGEAAKMLSVFLSKKK